MDRRRLEATATYLAVVVLGVLIVLSILGLADGIFAWDILPPLVEKVATLVMSALFVVLGACVLVSIMLNVSIIADKISRLADRDAPDE
jgi:hypothetical protein